ncbi:MAG TPA: PIN domain-containing protein, partial [Acidobacteriota bacterium]
LLRKLQGKSLAFDSRFLLYHLEPDSRFEPVTSALLRLVESGKSRASASILVLHDLYLRLALSKDRDAVATCQAVLLNFPNLRFVSIDEQIVADAAYLQSEHGLDAWIALHLSCARNDGAKFFVTASSGLPPVPEIETVLLESIQP